MNCGGNKVTMNIDYHAASRTKAQMTQINVKLGWTWKSETQSTVVT